MRDKQAGTYNGDFTYCTVNAYGDCPYCDQCNVCHIEDPIADCEDFAMFFEDWDEWLRCDEPPEYDEDYDVGFDPFLGMFTDDC